jgi:hypothetical protein
LNNPRRITVISRQRCELCAELLDQLAPYVSAGRLSLEEIDVDTDPALLALHAWRVPVVMENGRELLWGRIEPAEVQASFGPSSLA